MHKKLSFWSFFLIFAVFFDSIQWHDYMVRSIFNKSSISDLWIEQTDDQALGRPRIIYIEDKRAQKAGVFLFLPDLLQSLLTLFNDVTMRWDWSFNKPSISDSWIEQTDDQALDRSRIIYTENKRAQWLRFCCFYLIFCSFFSIQQHNYMMRLIFQQIFNFWLLNWTNKWSSSRQIYTSRSYIYIGNKIELSS